MSASDRTVQLGHGSGGRWTHDLIREVFVSRLSNPLLDPLGDSATLPPLDGRLAMTTDSFVVSPLFFAGGNIGDLAVHGTVNDLAVAGAVPRYLSCGFILEEGLEIASLERIVDTMAAAAKRARVQIVTGDTKVVERGKGDGVFINTAGIGVLRDGYPSPRDQPAEGDRVIVSGPLGDHGAVILSSRAGIGLRSELQSDSAPVTPFVDALFAAGVTPTFMRDPTRGGIAATLVELAEDSGLGVVMEQDDVPIRAEVASICDVLGIEALHLANEGRVVAVVHPDDVDRALGAWRACSGGSEACEIAHLGGDVARPGRVTMRTAFGGTRIIDRPVGEPLPRIC